MRRHANDDVQNDRDDLGHHHRKSKCNQHHDHQQSGRRSTFWLKGALAIPSRSCWRPHGRGIVIEVLWQMGKPEDNVFLQGPTLFDLWCKHNMNKLRVIPQVTTLRFVPVQQLCLMVCQSLIDEAEGFCSPAGPVQGWRGWVPYSHAACASCNAHTFGVVDGNWNDWQSFDREVPSGYFLSEVRRRGLVLQWMSTFCSRTCWVLCSLRVAGALHHLCKMVGSAQCSFRAVRVMVHLCRSAALAI